MQKLSSGVRCWRTKLQHNKEQRLNRVMPMVEIVPYSASGLVSIKLGQGFMCLHARDMSILSRDKNYAEIDVKRSMELHSSIGRS